MDEAPPNAVPGSSGSGVQVVGTDEAHADADAVDVPHKRSDKGDLIADTNQWVAGRLRIALEFELVGQGPVDVVVDLAALVEIDRNVVPFAIGRDNGLGSGPFADAV